MGVWPTARARGCNGDGLRLGGARKGPLDPARSSMALIQRAEGEPAPNYGEFLCRGLGLGLGWFV